jgi:geranylgeranyl diphosphate synthase type II
MPVAHPGGQTRPFEPFDFPAYLAGTTAMVNRALDRFLPRASAKPATLHRAMRYSLFAGGKRLRPALCLAAAAACGGSAPAALPLACAVECIHTYSLIHDDLPCMDDDDLRRGKPTNHKVFGEGIAVLAGDALLTEAFAMVAKSQPPKRYRIEMLVRDLALAAGSLRLIAGQVQDLEGEDRQLALEEVKRTHLNKTAALITASIRLGAMAGNASSSALTRLTRYGQDLGLAFQVIDDILDATSTKEIMGKSVRADEKNKKSTFPIVLGLDKSKQFAADLIADAHKQLSVFGKPAEPLRAIADFFLTRQH